MTVITSPTNPLVKDLVRLRDRRHRDREGRFLIEGRRPVRIAAEAGVDLTQVIVCPDLIGEPDFDAPVIEMALAPFEKISARQNPDGVIAVANHLDLDLARLVPSRQALVLMVQSVEKPGNLGAILRTADAAGAEAVIVADPATDVHNPNVVRASQGALFTVPLAVTTAGEGLAWLADHGIMSVATSPAAEHVIWDADLTGPVALMIGAESTGLSPALLEAATITVSLPMRGTLDSLNASVSAALAMYEALRQRR